MRNIPWSFYAFMAAITFLMGECIYTEYQQKTAKCYPTPVECREFVVEPTEEFPSGRVQVCLYRCHS